MDTIDEILACLRAWEPSARVLGNVRAQDAIEAIERLRDELAEVQEKALRFDLDQAGIEQREREVVELVTLRAELAECRAKHMDDLLVLSETAKAERELRAELAECKRDAERYRTALEQIVAPFEDLNFVSGNKPLTYIHDVATDALAAKGE